MVSGTLLKESPEPGDAGKERILSLDCPIAVISPFGKTAGWSVPGRSPVAVISSPVRTSALRDLLMGNEPDYLERKIVSETPEMKADRPLRVLLAEDNPVNRKIAVAMLERIGCSVDVVGDGEAAVNQIRTASYDLVLMDCQMPVLDGFDATRAIREQERETGAGRIPIIALTASALTGDREACLAAGMDDYIAKPFRLEHLQRVVNTWVNTQAC